MGLMTMVMAVFCERDMKMRVVGLETPMWTVILSRNYGGREAKWTAAGDNDRVLARTQKSKGGFESV